MTRPIWQRMDSQPLLFKARIFHVHAKDVRLDQQRLDEVGIRAAQCLSYTQTAGSAM